MEFERRAGQVKAPRGAKTGLVTAAVERLGSIFRVADVQDSCPGVSIDLIRRVLSGLQKAGRIRSLGTGRSAQWEKLGPSGFLWGSFTA